jgi:hypothetical protein
MMGVVVEVVLEVRPHTPIISRGYTTYTKTGAEAVKAVLKARGRCDALFAILVPDRGYVYLETRTKVGMGFRIRLWVGFTVQECRLGGQDRGGLAQCVWERLLMYGAGVRGFL